RVLAGGTRTLEVERVDQRTLRIRGADGLLARLGEMLTRRGDPRPAGGARGELPGMTVEIEAVTDDGRPATALYRFAAPLEDSHYRWRQWQGRGFVAFPPPAVGQKVGL